jgi:hypothetical protein
MKMFLFAFLWGSLLGVPVFGQDQGAVLADVPPSFHQDPLLSNVHLSLGIATLASGLATGIFNGTWVDVKIHRTLGYTTAGLALSTMILGAWAHWGEVGTNASITDTKNIHALLGVLGGSMMVAAPFVAPADAHRVLGVGGELLMGFAVAWKFAY